eukprot:gene12062-biopygen3858
MFPGVLMQIRALARRLAAERKAEAEGAPARGRHRAPPRHAAAAQSSTKQSGAPYPDAPRSATPNWSAERRLGGAGIARSRTGEVEDRKLKGEGACVLAHVLSMGPRTSSPWGRARPLHEAAHVLSMGPRTGWGRRGAPCAAAAGERGSAARKELGEFRGRVPKSTETRLYRRVRLPQLHRLGWLEQCNRAHWVHWCGQLHLCNRSDRCNRPKRLKRFN